VLYRLSACARAGCLFLLFVWAAWQFIIVFAVSRSVQTDAINVGSEEARLQHRINCSIASAAADRIFVHQTLPGNMAGCTTATARAAVAPTVTIISIEKDDGDSRKPAREGGFRRSAAAAVGYSACSAAALCI
jgi:hypothetical protein